MEIDVWTFRESRLLGIDPTLGVDLDGYEVEAIEGQIGKVDAATAREGGGYIVVDTGPWIFGKKVLLPAGVIERVDANEEKLYVNRTKDQIKSAPEYDESLSTGAAFPQDVGDYYRAGAGHRDWPDGR